MEGRSMSTTLPPFAKEFDGKPLLIFDNGGFAYINPTLFHDFLAQDVETVQANILAVVEKPGNISGIANEKSGPPACKQHPTWYQVSENDHAIPPILEHMFLKQMNATTISLPSSHASLISNLNEIAQLILNGTKGITKYQTYVKKAETGHHKTIFHIGFQHVFRRLSHNVEMLEIHSDIVEPGQVSIPNYESMEDRKTA